MIHDATSLIKLLRILKLKKKLRQFMLINDALVQSIRWLLNNLVSLDF
jgi:hypothetical protein